MFIYSKMPRSVSAEVYKSIRTSLKYASVDKKVKTLVITSSVPGEGKSTVAGNLGICLGESGSRVLIVDCDLRRPTLHRKFGCSNMLGLTNILIDSDLIGEAIYEYSPRVHVLPAGNIPPNPSELLGSNTFEKFLSDVSKRYDYVLLDTPPILAVTDAKLLSGKADGTLFMVKYGKTKERLIIRAYNELEKVNTNVLGTIINVCDKKRGDIYYSYYGQKRSFWKRNKKRKRLKNRESSVTVRE